jgi:hypothetical protein
MNNKNFTIMAKANSRLFGPEDFSKEIKNMGFGRDYYAGYVCIPRGHPCHGRNCLDLNEEELKGKFYLSWSAVALDRTVNKAISDKWEIGFDLPYSSHEEIRKVLDALVGWLVENQ